RALPGSPRSCSSPPSRRATSSCCAPRRARRTCWPRPSTTPSSPGCSAPSRGTTRSSSSRATPTGRRSPSASSRSAPDDPPQSHLNTTTGKRSSIMTERVVLAYSGGLDTSVAIGWIAEATGAEVVAVAVDVGQGGEDMNVIRQRALDCGAVEAYIADARDEFAAEYCMPALRANGMYLDRYPLVSAISRPVIVKHLVRAARQFGASTVAHGCTGKGNDQVRFEVATPSPAPDL